MRTPQHRRPDDYRVPDRAYRRERPAQAFVPSAVIVVEMVSRRDDSYRKFDFCFAHGVQVMLVVDPLERSVRWYPRGADSLQRVRPGAASKCHLRSDV